MSLSLIVPHTLSFSIENKKYTYSKIKKKLNTSTRSILFSKITRKAVYPLRMYEVAPRLIYPHDIDLWFHLVLQSM